MDGTVKNNSTVIVQHSSTVTEQHSKAQKGESDVDIRTQQETEK